ncbi:MAG: VOC family protein [Adhaeribacter sp.]
MKIPPQYLPLMPYLILKEASGFLQFMKTVFNATEQLLMPADDNKITHGELRIGEAVIMFADATEQWLEKPAGMYVYVAQVPETYAKAIAQGATSLMEPQMREYGFTAGFQDAFGNDWWIVEPEKE